MRAKQHPPEEPEGRDEYARRRGTFGLAQFSTAILALGALSVVLGTCSIAGSPGCPPHFRATPFGLGEMLELLAPVAVAALTALLVRWLARQGTAAGCLGLALAFIVAGGEALLGMSLVAATMC